MSSVNRRERVPFRDQTTKNKTLVIGFWVIMVLILIMLPVTLLVIVPAIQDAKAAKALQNAGITSGTA